MIVTRRFFRNVHGKRIFGLVNKVVDGGVVVMRGGWTGATDPVTIVRELLPLVAGRDPALEFR
jgi:hypothetical protein